MVEANALVRERLRPYVEKAAKFDGWSLDLDAERTQPRPWDYKPA